MSAIPTPIDLYYEADGKPLEAGFVYFGDGDAIDSPINVYWDDALTILAAQPIRTQAGYPVRNGAPAQLYTSVNDFVVTTKDKNLRPILTNVPRKRLVDGDDLAAETDARVAADALRYTKTETDALIAVASYQLADGPRDVIIYAGAQSVKISRPYVAMGGFRYLGHYTRDRAPVFDMPASRVASLSTGQAALSATKADNWYAVFAVANDGDAAAQLVVMPFLRIATPSGLACPLIPAGEGVHDLVTTTSYSWSATDNLAGTECLVISGGGGWLGRVSTITANSASSISLDSVANLAAGDFLLPAPPGFDHYCYLGSFYRDTAEVRNIYDSGSIVTAKMIAVSSPNIASGAFASPTEINVRGYISPLATAVMVQSQVTISTATTGDYAEYFDGDSGNHTLDTKYITKVSTSSQTVVWPITTAPFLYHQSYWWSTAGGIAASRAGGAHLIVGWVEP